MKTFRWTIPEPGLSAIEEREHRIFSEKKGIKPKPTEYDDLGLEPKNWRERWALYKLNKNKTIWRSVWVVPYAGFLTFIWHDHDDMQPAIILMWVIVFLVVEDGIKSLGIRSVIARLKPNSSDPDAGGNG